MLSSKYRIPTKEFPRVLRGKVIQNDFFRVVFHYDESLKNPKCAVIVPQKIAKTAVARNATRRKVYEILGTIIKKVPTAYISVFPKKSLYKISETFLDLEKNLIALCLKK